MVMAVARLASGWRFFFYLVAVVAFGLAVVAEPVLGSRVRINLIAVGLFAFAFVPFWDSLAEL